MSNADINRIASELETDDIAAIIEELEQLPADAPAVVTSTSSEAAPVHLARWGTALTAGHAIEILAA